MTNFYTLTVSPLKVDIIRSESRFVAGERTDIQCQTIGSRPPAYITWWKDNDLLPDSFHEV